VCQQFDGSKAPEHARKTITTDMNVRFRSCLRAPIRRGEIGHLADFVCAERTLIPQEERGQDTVMKFELKHTHR
jgi:hypothetical protein